MSLANIRMVQMLSKVLPTIFLHLWLSPASTSSPPVIAPEVCDKLSQPVHYHNLGLSQHLSGVKWNDYAESGFCKIVQKVVVLYHHGVKKKIVMKWEKMK
jgi:hypothetical protein